MLLRCNGFTRIQKAILDQTGSRQPVTMTSFAAILALESALLLLLSLTTGLVVVQNSLFVTLHKLVKKIFLLFSHRIRENSTSKRWIFFSQSAQEAHTCQVFSPFFQMSKVHRMFNVELLGNFLCGYKKASFDDCSQLFSVNFRWPVIVLLIFMALVSFAKLLELALHCTFISSSWAKSFVDVASCLSCFMSHFELEFAFCLASFL